MKEIDLTQAGGEKTRDLRRPAAIAISFRLYDSRRALPAKARMRLAWLGDTRTISATRARG